MDGKNESDNKADWDRECNRQYGIADKHHLDANPDPVFHFDADPDPASQNDADTNPASQTDADPCGSGSVQQELGAGDINEGKIKIRGIIYHKEK